LSAKQRWSQEAFAAEPRSERTEEPFHIRNVVKTCGVSTPTLVARFKKTLGRTPIMELRRLRIAHAKRLLIEAETPLSEVARRCGFRSTPYFCAVFRETSGMTPLDYRLRTRLD